jgi:cyclophilin family peptidyl-prolyl cis-trans isomerase
MHAVIRSPRILLTASALAALALAACGSSAAKVDSGQPAGTGSTTTAPTGSTGATAESAGGACAKEDGSSPKQSTFAKYPPICIKDGTVYTAVLESTQGTVHIKLRNDIAPKTVNSFVNLARYHYFDGTTCHRAIKGFVVQCGDPTASGSGGPGYEFADELGKIEPYQVGSVAMANAGPNTNGSQFFIITGPQGAALPPNYTLFGQVDVADMGVVKAMDEVANPSDGPPLSPIDIKKISITNG